MKSKTAFIFVIFGILFGCEEIIDINLPKTKTKLVLNGFITNDSIVKVNITRNMNINENIYYDSIPFISNADVWLYENNNLVEKLSPKGKGNYHSTVKVNKTNTQYRIIAKAAGMDSAWTDFMIPEMVPLVKADTVFVEKQVIDYGGSTYKEKYYKLNISFDDPGKIQNYYLINAYVIYVDSVFSPEKLKFEKREIKSFLYLFSDDPIYGSDYYESGLVLSDEMFDGKRFEIACQLRLYPMGLDTLTCFVNLFSISKEYYTYLQSYKLYQSTHGNPLAEPVQLYSNVQNGRGVIGTGSFSQKRFDIPKNVLWKFYDYYPEFPTPYPDTLKPQK